MTIGITSGRGNGRDQFGCVDVVRDILRSMNIVRLLQLPYANRLAIWDVRSAGTHLTVRAETSEPAVRGFSSVSTFRHNQFGNRISAGNSYTSRSHIARCAIS